MDNNILLESGTGEVEILEFIVNGKHYGINVIKVKEIIEIDNITKLPLSHPSIAGLTLSRDEIITVIDLKYVLEQERGQEQNSNIIICEFNQLQVAFTFENIVGIHRMGWEAIKKPDPMHTNQLVIGNIVFEDRIILLLDFEKIVTDLSPSVGINVESIKEVEKFDRSKVKLMLADDSALIRELLLNTLTEAGYNNMKFFNDGQEALTYLTNIVAEKKEDFIDEVHVMITDIEMPQMDGHTLTRKVKEHDILRKLPVIIFSSLITDDLKHKGEAVGADAQMSKPEIAKLVSIVDGFTKDKIR